MFFSSPICYSMFSHDIYNDFIMYTSVTQVSISRISWSIGAAMDFRLRCALGRSAWPRGRKSSSAGLGDQVGFLARSKNIQCPTKGDEWYDRNHFSNEVEEFEIWFIGIHWDYWDGSSKMVHVGAMSLWSFLLQASVLGVLERAVGSATVQPARAEAPCDF